MQFVHCQVAHLRHHYLTMRRLAGISLAVLLLQLCGLQSVHAGLTPVSDTDLSNIEGQEGAALEFDFRINETPPPDPTTGPTPISGCGAPSTTGSSDVCRLALDLANRSNQWLVFKDVYGRLFIPNLYIDATTTPSNKSVVSAYDTPLSTIIGTTATPVKATTFQNLAVFTDPSGNCQLNCQGGTTPNPYNMPALQISMKNNSASGGASLYTNDNVATFNNTVSMALTIGGMAVENGATGYTANSNGSFEGLQMGDINPTYSTAPNFGGARIDYTGRVMVYGF